MKKKLTITIERDLIPQAKRLARERRVSLSSMIEAALREMTEGGKPSFAQRWRGSFEMAEREDVRYRSLAEKYG